MATSVFQPDVVSRLLAGVGLVSMVVALASLVMAHLRPTGLSPLRNPVSQYGISSAAPFYRAQTIAMALAALVLAVALQRCLHGGGVGEILVFLILFAAARALISWYPMDAPGAPSSSHGSIHRLLAFAAFISVSVAARLLNSFLSSNAVPNDWHRLSAALSLALVITLLLMLLARLSDGMRRYFGLIERLFYVSCISWLIMTCWVCAFLHG